MSLTLKVKWKIVEEIRLEGKQRQKNIKQREVDIQSIHAVHSFSRGHRFCFELLSFPNQKDSHVILVYWNKSYKAVVHDGHKFLVVWQNGEKFFLWDLIEKLLNNKLYPQKHYGSKCSEVSQQAYSPNISQSRSVANWHSTIQPKQLDKRRPKLLLCNWWDYGFFLFLLLSFFLSALLPGVSFFILVLYSPLGLPNRTCYRIYK